MLSPDHYPYVPRPERQPLNWRDGRNKRQCEYNRNFPHFFPRFYI